MLSSACALSRYSSKPLPRRTLCKQNLACPYRRLLRFAFKHSSVPQDGRDALKMENMKQTAAFEMVAEIKPNEFVDSRRLGVNAFTSWMSSVGLAMKTTNPGKNVVDCIRYRGKIGFDVALRECIRQHRCPQAELLKRAMVCRMTRIMRPYLEVLA